MLRRLIKAWRRHRTTAVSAEGHLAVIAERLAAAEARLSAWSERVEIQLKQLDLMNIHIGRIEHQLALSHPRFQRPLRLERYGRKVFSQTDEDGIIAEIFRRIGETSRVFVEVAAGDGKENCSAYLLSLGWSGLWVECDARNIQSIHSTWPKEIESGQLKISDQFVKKDNINEIINHAGVDEIDLLTIDIDGNDYHILDAINYRPRVICAEYLSNKPPPYSWHLPYDENYDLPMRFGAMTPGLVYGATLQALDDLLTPRGYSLVGCSLAGVNCFFVRSDLVVGKFEAPFTAQNHYNPPRYWYHTLNFQSQIWVDSAADTPPEEASVKHQLEGLR